jgi:hypothetical protein
MKKVINLLKQWSVFSGGFFLGTIYGSIVATLTCYFIFKDL